MWQIQHCSPLRSKCCTDTVQLALRSMAMSTWRIVIKAHLSQQHCGTQGMPLPRVPAGWMAWVGGVLQVWGMKLGWSVALCSVAEDIEKTFAHLRSSRAQVASALTQRGIPVSGASLQWFNCKSILFPTECTDLLFLIRVFIFLE